MLHNIKFIYLHCVFHGIRFKVNNEDWSVLVCFFVCHFGVYNIFLCRFLLRNRNSRVDVFKWSNEIFR